MNITRVGITENGDGSYRLTGLRKYTQYSIVVKAFNNKGDGPGSDPVTVQTLEDGERTTVTSLSFFSFGNFLNNLPNLLRLNCKSNKLFRFHSHRLINKLEKKILFSYAMRRISKVEQQLLCLRIRSKFSVK